MGIGTLEMHPIDLLGAYGTIADGGVHVPRRLITSIIDSNGQEVLTSLPQTGTRVVSSGAAGDHHRHPGRQHGHEGQPVLGQVGDLRRQDPPPGRLQDRHDERQPRRRGLRLPRPAGRRHRRPALAVGVWMGNSDNTPNDGKLSLDTSAPLWSAILTEISQGLPMADFHAPADLVTAPVDAFTGLQPGPFTTKTVDELFLPGTVPTQKETIRVTRQIDSATGLLWQDGCAGPEVSEGFFDLTQVDANFPAWQQADAEWGARAAQGPGVKGGPEGDPDRRTSTTTRSRRSARPGARRSRRPSCARSSSPPCDPLLGPCQLACDPLLGPCQPLHATRSPARVPRRRPRRPRPCPTSCACRSRPPA